MADRIQVRRGTANQWTTANPVLAAGEMGLETDTGYAKFGNGVSTWTARPYAIGATDKQVLGFACSDETTALTTGTKIVAHAPFNLTILSAFAGLTTAQVSGSLLTINVLKNGTTIFSTKITVDNTETTSLTAATAAVLSVTTMTAGDSISIAVDQVGTATVAAGLKVYLLVVPT